MKIPKFKFNPRLIPIIVVAGVLGIVFLMARSCSSPVPVFTNMQTVPEPPKPDADSPADTIKTLTANVSELISEVDALRRDNADLRDQRAQLESRLSNQLKFELNELRDDLARPDEAASSLFEIERRIENLNSKIDKLELSNESFAISIGDGSQDFDSSSALFDTQESVFWIQPLDAIDQTYGFGFESSIGEDIEPKLTVPRNATLIDATAMTALVGRVPLDGSVHDPMPFKVLTGTRNLSANGFTIDGLEGMVWSGWAVGDWTLSCVSGYLNSVTFIFNDGTIYSETIEDAGDAQAALGWISDEYGMPCIRGERKSNAVAYLAQQALLQTSSAAAAAAAAVQTTRQLDALGGASSIVTGDIERYISGQALAESANTTSHWLERRANQEFDAVVIPAGQTIAIHVNQELHIDYDRGGRKLSYEKNNTTTTLNRLD